MRGLACRWLDVLKVMVELKQAGLVRHIGLCNFDVPALIKVRTHKVCQRACMHAYIFCWGISQPMPAATTACCSILSGMHAAELAGPSPTCPACSPHMLHLHRRILGHASASACLLCSMAQLPQ